MLDFFKVRTPGLIFLNQRKSGYFIPFFLFFSLLVSVNSGYGQVYPEWFLNPEKLHVSHAVAGYADPAFYADSAVTQAYLNGCETFAKETTCQYSGGQFYWSTEIGVFWIGNDVQEVFDSSATALAKNVLVAADTFVTDKIVMVLATNEPPSDDASLFKLRKTRSKSSPDWIKELPENSEFIYATGLAPLYFHEKSSWLQAEQRARHNLARTILLNVNSVQQSDVEGQDKRYEDLGITNINSRVVSRWFDPKDEICHVLVKMKK